MSLKHGKGECARGISYSSPLFSIRDCRHMSWRPAFFCGWLVSWVAFRPTPQGDSLIRQIAELREDIKSARETVTLLSDQRLSCEWETWSLKWLWRVASLLDLILVVWILALKFCRAPQPRVLAIEAGTGGSSSDSEEATTGQSLAIPVKGGLWGKGVVAKKRPTRPSDLRQGK